jgi:hypothetical protein
MDIIGRPLGILDVKQEIQLSRKIRGYNAGEWEDDTSYKTFRERWYERNEKHDLEAFWRDWL